MNRFTAFTVVTLVLPCILVAETPATAPAEPEEMKTIFNGRDLTGWDGDARLWSVRDGAIRGETTRENPTKGNTFLIYRGGTLKDFELRLSFRCTAANNSGIQYRSSHVTKGRTRNPWVVRGYQHEIRNEHTLPNVAGFIYDEGGRRRRMCLVGEKAEWGADGERSVSDTRLIGAEEYKKLFRLDDWNDVVIIAKEAHICHYLNGRLIVECTDNHPDAKREGVLALQLHAGKPMWAEFRNIRLRVIE